MSWEWLRDREGLRAAVTAEVLALGDRERNGRGRSCMISQSPSGTMRISVPTGYDEWVADLKARYGESVQVEEVDRWARAVGGKLSGPY